MCPGGGSSAPVFVDCAIRSPQRNDTWRHIEDKAGKFGDTVEIKMFIVSYRMDLNGDIYEEEAAGANGISVSFLFTTTLSSWRSITLRMLDQVHIAVCRRYLTWRLDGWDMTSSMAPSW